MMSSINTVVKMVREEFEKVPFHNLFLLNGIKCGGTAYGGTCSDKALHFKDKLTCEGVQSQLCSGFINGLETHRLLLVKLEGGNFFIDIGNAWPCLQPFPLDTAVEYEAFGILFKSVLKPESMEIYKSGKNGLGLMVSIPLEQKPEPMILGDIKSRFRDLSVYPFRNSIRFAQVLGDSFYFLKGNVLLRYREDGSIEKETGLDIFRIEKILRGVFEFEYPPEFKDNPLYPKMLL